MTYGTERRWFLKVMLATAAGGVLAACGGGKEQDNSQLVEYLKNELGITPTTTREELAEMAYKKAIDPTWFINKPIGNFKNTRGESLKLSTDNIGELVVETQYIREITYPFPTVQEVKPFTFQHDGKENQLIVYGTLGTISRSKGYGEDIIKSFLDQYFNGSKSPVNIVHLDFNPVMSGPAFSAATPWNLNKETGEVTYPILEVLIRVHRAHHFAENLGMNLENILRHGFTNEAIGFLGNQFPETGGGLIRGRINESYSTLAALASALDPSVADLTLGGTTHLDLFPSIVEEMGILAEIGRK